MKTLVALAILSSCLFCTMAQAADDPQTGRWTLDLKRSKYVTTPLPQKSITTVTPFGDDGITIDVDAVNADGKESRIHYSAKYDGKHYPRTETGFGAVPGQTVVLRKTGPRTVERTVYMGDKPGGTETWTISADGKTRNSHQGGVDYNGKPINNLQIYVKP